jgi:hypothetical protein
MKMPVDRRLLGLAIVHCVFGLFAGFVARLTLPVPMRLNLLPIIVSGICQAFLLALWGVTSAAAQWKRIAGLLAGTVYVETLLVAAVESDIAGVATITIVGTAASLLVVRTKGLRCVRHVQTDASARPMTEPMRFSIRSLMLLIAAAALLITVARTVREFPMPAKILPANIFFSFSIVTVGLLALWAVLGAARPVPRAWIVLILSPVLGVLFAIAADADRDGWVLIVLTLILYSATMVASLLIVRSCGYRFVKQGEPEVRNVAVPFQKRGYPHSSELRPGGDSGRSAGLADSQGTGLRVREAVAKLMQDWKHRLGAGEVGELVGVLALVE